MPCFCIVNYDSAVAGIEPGCDASLQANGCKFGADFERSGEVVGKGENRWKIQVVAYRLQGSGAANGPFRPEQAGVCLTAGFESNVLHCLCRVASIEILHFLTGVAR